MDLAGAYAALRRGGVKGGGGGGKRLGKGMGANNAMSMQRHRHAWKQRWGFGGTGDGRRDEAWDTTTQ